MRFEPVTFKRHPARAVSAPWRRCGLSWPAAQKACAKLYEGYKDCLERQGMQRGLGARQFLFMKLTGKKKRTRASRKAYLCVRIIHADSRTGEMDRGAWLVRESNPRDSPHKRRE